MNPLSAILPFALIIILQQVFAAMKPFQIKDITAELPKSSTKTYGRRSLSQIVRYVIHHSATSGGDPWSFARYHVQTNGWPGIGYHFVIMPDGTTYQTNALETISYGVENMNTGAVNTCLVGNFEVTKPTAAQINAVVYLHKDLAARLGQKPIVGHNDLKQTTKCPGKNLDPDEISEMVYGPNV